MIRPFTFLCALLACGSGLYLYHSKHEAQLLDRDIARVLRATSESRARIETLKNEWQNLNEADRLRTLSQIHLGLKTMEQSQLVTMADLGSRLPAPTPGAIYVPAEGPVPPPSPPMPAPIVATATRTPAPARPAGPVLAATATLAATAEPVAVPRPRPAMVASAHAHLPPSPAPAPQRTLPILAVNATPIVSAPRAAPAGMSIGESVLRASRANAASVAAYVSAPLQPAPAWTATASTTPAAMAPSMLGGARPALPPPVPYAAAR